MSSKILVTLTAPSCSGKSYLLEHIKENNLACLVSTTTRAPRAGEIDGSDYIFISEEESLEIEKNNGFAELAIYRGIRYGVTKEEFFKKLETGLAFLIVEPTGIDHYAQPAIDFGAKHVKMFVDTPLDIRIARFMKRANEDMNYSLVMKNNEYIMKMFNTCLNRLQAMLSEEIKWKDMVEWDCILDGTDKAENNIEKILQAVKIHS